MRVDGGWFCRSQGAVGDERLSNGECGGIIRARRIRSREGEGKQCKIKQVRKAHMIVLEETVRKELGHPYRGAGFSMVLPRLHVSRALRCALLLHLLCLRFFLGEFGWHRQNNLGCGKSNFFLKTILYVCVCTVEGYFQLVSPEPLSAWW